MGKLKMNADSSELSKFMTGNSSNYFPLWPPNSKRIVFMSSGPYPTGKDICIMDADGSNMINLTNTPDIDDSLPVWSPQ